MRVSPERFRLRIVMPSDSVAASGRPESSDYGQARRPSKGPDQTPSSIKIILLPVSAVSWLHPAEGRLRGEIRDDEPAESLAVILLYAVLFGGRRGAAIGRPPGSTPLGRLALSVVLRGLRP